MMAPVQFHGTPAEARVLLDVLNHNCECEMPLGIRLSTCPVHTALINDQKWLDHLLFARRWITKRYPRASQRVIRA